MPPNALQSRDFCPFETHFPLAGAKPQSGYMAYQNCSGRRKPTGAGTPMKCRKCKKDVKPEGANSSKSFRISKSLNKKIQNEPRNKGEKRVFETRNTQNNATKRSQERTDSGLRLSFACHSSLAASLAAAKGRATLRPVDS